MTRESSSICRSFCFSLLTVAVVLQTSVPRRWSPVVGRSGSTVEDKRSKLRASFSIMATQPFFGFHQLFFSYEMLILSICRKGERRRPRRILEHLSLPPFTHGVRLPPTPPNRLWREHLNDSVTTCRIKSKNILH